jgi:dipeptidyl-peptidase-4
MMVLKLRLFIVIVLLALTRLHASAQGTRADYERAGKLRELTQRRVFKARVEAHWLADKTRFWYRNELPNNAREFVLVDAKTGIRTAAFNHAKVAAALNQATNYAVTPDHLPMTRIDFDGGNSAMTFRAFGKSWHYDLQTAALSEVSGKISEDSMLALDRPHPSLRTGEETTITFINHSRAPVDLYWITPEGGRQHYVVVPVGEQRTMHTFAGHVWMVADDSGKALKFFEAVEGGGDAVIEDTAPEKATEGSKSDQRADRDSQIEQGISPDGHWRAFIQNHNVYLRDLQSGEEVALSTDGNDHDAYQGRIYWSPDSKKIALLRTQPGENRVVHLIESSPSDQLQPKLQTFPYAKPGDRIDISKPQLFDVIGRKHIPIEDALFPNPWSISELRWTPDASRLFFLYNQRGHQVLRMISVDAESGKPRAIVNEESKTFLDYAGKYFGDYLEKTSEIIWMSERDGWNHLYLYDAESGRVKNQITKGEWVVRGVEWVDEEHRQVWFRAGGIRPEQDPYYVHYCRVNFDGSGLTILTEGNGTHSVTFSPDHRFFIDTWSRADAPPVNELRRSEDGKLICELEKADWSELLKAGWRAPEPFTAKGRDGTTNIYGLIYRPTNFDPTRKYPIIENIYAGPQDSHVPKAFSTFDSSQKLAELGFIVVRIDGMGTSNRSKAFHDVCWKNLGDAGFPDRIPWIKAAAAKYPYLDLSRVGLYGTSAGGQNAMRGLIAHGDFYKAAVADCGCHDNRMDKIWWNELWMGWPVGPEYAEQSNVVQAHRMQGKLLLMVGELDKNVDPASTMQVVNALIKANKDFDLLVVPGAGHGTASTPYGERKLDDFFVRNLLGVEPRSQP